jgi:DNA-binding transcriptional ArsR family regulator
MKARREFRSRADVDVAVLDALVDRAGEGMTVFELRSEVDADIDAIEAALSRLKADGLIDVEEAEERTLIYPADRVVPDPGEAAEPPSLVEEIRRRLPF